VPLYPPAATGGFTNHAPNRREKEGGEEEGEGDGEEEDLAARAAQDARDKDDAVSFFPVEIAMTLLPVYMASTRHYTTILPPRAPR
jgi:hypothetical protein